MRGHHIYEDIWQPVVGEELTCGRERFNAADPFAVAVVKGEITVGHVPRNISVMCSLFLRRRGTILCHVIGARRFSADLPQGGLEVPCTLTFQGDSKDLDKVKKLIQSALADSSAPKSPPCKKIKTEPLSPKKAVDTANQSDTNKTWVQLGGIVLSNRDKAIIIDGEQLNDKHVDFAQLLLKMRFLGFNGLPSTLLQSKKQPLASTKHVVQVVHSRGDHWITISTVNADEDMVNVYDSIYTVLDKDTTITIHKLLQVSPRQTQMVHIQKQEGVKDCGVFSIAVATALAHHLDPATLKFHQAIMRQHLVDCFDQQTLEPFPTQ